MKIEKAILILQGMYKRSTRMVKGTMQGGFINPEQSENKAVNLAIEVLERQIPTKVTKSNYKYKAVDVETNRICYYDASRCPKCDKWLTKIYKHCPHCGQRIIGA